MTLDRVDIATLHHGLRRDDFLAEAALLSALDQTAQAGARIGGDHAQEAVQIAVVEDVPFADQRAVIGKNIGGARHGLVVALDFQAIVQQAGADIQFAFEQADIFIASPEQRLNAAADLYAGLHSRKNKGRLFKPDIR
jgi:hypothetical protein